MKYRPEINGLRALAILPVLYFHAGFPGLPGGFVGVDVFFVISGFLISTIIFEDLKNDAFSFTRFFSRRIGRLLPNLFLVVIISIPAAWLVLSPLQMTEFGWSVIGAATFTSNIVFGLQSDYFNGSDVRPLLHTWSLGVEEQYYLLIPALLFVLYYWRKNEKVWLYALAATTLLSFSLALWASSAFPQLSYYSLPTRLWELGVGGLAAFLIFSKRILPLTYSRAASNWLSSFGLLGILVSFIFVNETSEYPGLTTLLPVLSSVIVIVFASGDTFVGRLLGNRLLVAIGVLSYSLYLWHQPSLSLVSTWLSNRRLDPNQILVAQLATLVLVFFLSYLTYKYVESPFRLKSRKNDLLGQRRVVKCGLLASGGRRRSQLQPVARRND
jgi:peptidoglycan/LPS O-acetylase OafA/YrhL